MDGYKKIIGIAIVSAIALALFSCRVRMPTYAGLYVDNSIPHSDSTAYIGKVPLGIGDITAIIEAERESDSLPVKKMIMVSSDSVYLNEVKNQLKRIADSVQLLHRQVFELQRQFAGIPDTSIIGEKLQTFRQTDSSLKEADLKQLLRVKNDTITMLRNQISELVATQFQIDSIQIDRETARLLRSKDDTILSLREQLDEPRSNGVVKTDTVYVIRETAGTSTAENQKNDQLILQLLRSKDELINNLQNQVNSLQSAPYITPGSTQTNREQVQPSANQQPDYYAQQLRAKDDQIQLLQGQLNQMQSLLTETSQQDWVTGEPRQSPLPDNQQADPITMRMFLAKNDTIQSLKNQLRNLQLISQKIDTVYIEKDFQSLHDTIELLKSQVLSLEKQIMTDKDTTISAGQNENAMITDTTLLVAYYLMEEIIPIEEENILQQIKELDSNKIVVKATLSGYTDSSGDEIINKEITNRRLNYLSEMIAPWIEKEKIFFQNFGDTFASDIVIKEERRVEIRIYTKQDNSF
jgi:hypothetical protein